MRTLLCAGFGSPLTSGDKSLIKSLGFYGIRTDVRAREDVQILVENLVGSMLFPIFVVDYFSGYAAEIAQDVTAQATALLPDFAIEIGNELNIGGAHPAVNPDAYADQFAEIEDACRRLNKGVTIMTGGVFGLSHEAQDWIRRAISKSSTEAIVAYHSYRKKNSYPASRPWDGFSSRDEEFTLLKKSAGGRRIWCTECGWHTAPETSGWGPFKHTTQLTDHDVYIRLKIEMDVEAVAGAEVMCVYQFQDGPDPNSGLDRYGIRTVDGKLKLQSTICSGG